MKLKTKIKVYLRVHRMKIYRLENMAGVGRGVIYRYLKGERGMSLRTAEKIMKIVDTGA